MAINTRTRSIQIKMEVRTLSSFPGVPFNNTFENFLDTYSLSEDIECYQLLFCPYGNGSSFENLREIKFESRVVVLNVMDLIIDKYDNIALDELSKFCADYPEQNFIIFNFNLNLQSQFNIPNLYLDTIIPTNLTEPLQRCEKKDISNRWLSLNRDTKLHRAMTVSYLLSKDYYQNGDITFDMDSDLLVKYDKYKNVTEIPERLKKDFSIGYQRFKSKEFNLLNISDFDQVDSRVASNYNTNLLPLYENVGIEIITGTMFFEKVPTLTEKEVQSVFGKNFPIYINGIGMAREIKKLFDIDLFDDIIDHSYDEIEDHFERLAAAIDRNEHLLDGSTNIKELWFDNQQRFEDNCNKVDSMLFDQSYQRIFNEEKIKQSLDHFKITVKRKLPSLTSKN